MFRVIEFNTETAHREVLAEYLDTDDSPKLNVDRNLFRRAALQSFVTTDTDHVQYIEDIAC